MYSQLHLIISIVLSFSIGFILACLISEKNIKHHKKLFEGMFNTARLLHEEKLKFKTDIQKLTEKYKA